MSFDIHFLPARYQGTVESRTDPFSGKSVSISVPEPLSKAELKAVRGVLNNAQAEGPDEFGCYVITLADGETIELFGENLASSCMVAVSGLTPALLDFLFALLQAGNWAMLPIVDDALSIVASADAVQNAPPDFPPTIVCQSSAELGVLLSKGVAAWKKYLNQLHGK